ncbi:hypothetical protein [Microbispora bryophytorum]|uniref:Uncharacterized protein n=1 Tax=Microbispora bryophytorum subsp. camponoti TaxID=1677852 RepID=A0ABR8LFX2_9ACTN|nr:hypothetical protein [Microbispora camponoti]MBD3148410.1 hypothetical protein [Microbispora camponoti]
MVDHPSGSINHWLAVWEVNSSYARRPEHGDGRRMWAETAMYALARAEDAGLDAVTANVQRFRLRAWMINNLGPASVPIVDPDALVADILAALPLRLEDAAEWAPGWRQRSLAEILALRQCKNLLAPAQIVRHRLSVGPPVRVLDRWLALRERLP